MQRKVGQEQGSQGDDGRRQASNNAAVKITFLQILYSAEDRQRMLKFIETMRPVRAQLEKFRTLACAPLPPRPIGRLRFTLHLRQILGATQGAGQVCALHRRLPNHEPATGGGGRDIALHVSTGRVPVVR
jgi:hypothetical protein